MNKKYLMYVFVIGFLFLLKDAKSAVNGPLITVPEELFLWCNAWSKICTWEAGITIWGYLKVKVKTELVSISQQISLIDKLTGKIKVFETILCPNPLNKRCSLQAESISILASKFSLVDLQG
ncbi:hypothetical protein MXB_2388, partial [Myxobolus squamalis]